MRTVMRQMGPGMYSQSTLPCDECSGAGEMIDMEKRCKKCKGKKIMRDNDADFGGEHSAHFYLRENFYADSGILTLLIFLT